MILRYRKDVRREPSFRGIPSSAFPEPQKCLLCAVSGFLSIPYETAKKKRKHAARSGRIAPQKQKHSGSSQNSSILRCVICHRINALLSRAYSHLFMYNPPETKKLTSFGIFSGANQSTCILHIHASQSIKRTAALRHQIGSCSQLSLVCNIADERAHVRLFWINPSQGFATDLHV